MGKNNGGAASHGQLQATPIIGQRFLDEDIPAQFRKIPTGVPLPLAGLFHGDKEQLARIEAKLDRVLELLQSSEPRAEASGHSESEPRAPALSEVEGSASGPLPNGRGSDTKLET